MNETIPVHVRLASVLALLTVLALLAAPVCAPLCAAGACPSGNGHEQCHEMASMGASSGEQFIASSKACGSSDLSAVLVKADGETLLSQEVRSSSAPAVTSGAPEQSLGDLQASPGRWRVHGVPLESADPFPRMTVFRI